MKAEESHCFETENKGADIMATTDNTFGDAGSIAALMRSDEQAGSDLIKRHQHIIDAVYRRYRLRLEDAADLSQTVWMKAIDNNLHRIRDLRAMPDSLEFPASQSEPIVARIASHPWEVAPRS
jgi:hypothetical protein